MSSKQPSLTVRLAAAHLRILELEKRPIEYMVARELHADYINSLFHYDHASPEYFSGSMHPAELTPRLIREHRVKTKRDQGIIAKSKRIVVDQEKFRRAMLRKAGQETGPHATGLRSGIRRWPAGRKIQSRPFPKGHRPLRGHR